MGTLDIVNAVVLTLKRIEDNPARIERNYHKQQEEAVEEQGVFG